jgi:hypothetical protein
MMTTETYADLAPGKNELVYGVYFFSFLLIGHLLLVSLLMGVTFDVFCEHTQVQLKSERLKELKGLLKAFMHMDPDRKGIVTPCKCSRIVNHDVQ